MLRNSACRLLGLARAAGSRSLTTSAAPWQEAAVAAGPKEFADTWNKVAPSTMVVPEVPSNFIESSSESAVEGDKFKVNFYTPHGVIADGVLKEELTLPGVSGELGVKANHVPIIVQLKPGVVQLHAGGAEIDKYFVSGGFAFVHPNGAADICALEAAPLDQFDVAAVKTALSTAGSGGGAGAGEVDELVSAAAVELYSSLDSALETHK